MISTVDQRVSLKQWLACMSDFPNDIPIQMREKNLCRPFQKKFLMCWPARKMESDVLERKMKNEKSGFFMIGM